MKYIQEWTMRFLKIKLNKIQKFEKKIFSEKKEITHTIKSHLSGKKNVA